MRAPDLCPGCLATRRLVERLVAAGIDWLDACDAPSVDLEDDEREVVSEDDDRIDPPVARSLT